MRGRGVAAAVTWAVAAVFCMTREAAIFRRRKNALQDDHRVCVFDGDSEIPGLAIGRDDPFNHWGFVWGLRHRGGRDESEGGDELVHGPARAGRVDAHFVDRRIVGRRCPLRRASSLDDVSPTRDDVSPQRQDVMWRRSVAAAL